MKTVKSTNNEVQIDVLDEAEDGDVQIRLTTSMFTLNATFDRLDLFGAFDATDAAELTALRNDAHENTRKVDDLRTRTRQLEQKTAKTIQTLQGEVDRLGRIVHDVHEITRDLKDDTDALHTIHTITGPFEMPTKAGVRFEAVSRYYGTTKQFTTLDGGDQTYYKTDGTDGGFHSAETITEHYTSHRLLT